MTSNIDQLLNKLTQQHLDKLVVYEQEELVWLVALLFTEEFYGKSFLHLHYDREKRAYYFKKVQDFVTSNKEAKKCLALIKRELIYEENEVKPEQPELERFKSLDFFYWAEAKGYKIPPKVIEGLTRLIEMDFHRKQSEAEEKRLFPELKKEDFELFKKEPLWGMDKAVLYVNGINTEAKFGDVRRYIKSKPHIAKLCLYATQAYRAKKLPLVIDSLPEPDTGNQNEPNYVLIEHCSVAPDDFIAFVKGLPLDFPILRAEADQKTEKPLKTTERNTLLKLVIGMAVAGYKYKPGATKNSAIPDIAGDLDQLGITVTDDTIRKWLNEAVELLPQEAQEA